MNEESVTRRAALIGRWVWLLPAAYACHVVEEAYGGSGLIGWMCERGGARQPMAFFLGINLVGLAIMAVAAWAARRSSSWLWLLAAAGTILFMNGLSHIAASIAMGYYVSGMWTGIALYLPLGAALLLRVRRLVRPRVFWPAVAAGFVIHAAVLWIAVFGSPWF
jgi:hypothetical protein